MDAIKAWALAHQKKTAIIVLATLVAGYIVIRLL